MYMYTHAWKQWNLLFRILVMKHSQNAHAYTPWNHVARVSEVPLYTICTCNATAHEVNPCVDADCILYTLHIVPPVSWNKKNIASLQNYLHTHTHTHKQTNKTTMKLT